VSRERSQYVESACNGLEKGILSRRAPRLAGCGEFKGFAPAAGPLVINLGVLGTHRSYLGCCLVPVWEPFCSLAVIEFPMGYSIWLPGVPQGLDLVA